MILSRPIKIHGHNKALIGNHFPSEQDCPAHETFPTTYIRTDLSWVYIAEGKLPFTYIVTLLL